MFSTAILVFREVLEAALIIGLVGVATREVPNRFKWISVGILGGIIGAIVIALMADVINAAASGLGQELMNAIILFAAVAMLGWHNIWMKKHGSELAKHAKSIGHAVSAGQQPMYALTMLVGLAVLREGAEVVLFLYSMFAAGTPVSQIGTGGMIGVAVGTLFGAGLYFGLLRIPTRYLFRVTSIMLLMLSAGLAAQAAGFLVQADIISVLTTSLWDTSWLVSERSVFGSILHALIGYIANPMGIQLVFYVTTIMLIGSLMWLVDRPQPVRYVKPVAAVVVTLLCSALLLLSPKTHAAPGYIGQSVQIQKLQQY
jgi:high-affinity iron transporter